MDRILSFPVLWLHSRTLVTHPPYFGHTQRTLVGTHQWETLFQHDHKRKVKLYLRQNRHIKHVQCRVKSFYCMYLKKCDTKSHQPRKGNMPNRSTGGLCTFIGKFCAKISGHFDLYSYRRCLLYSCRMLAFARK